MLAKDIISRRQLVLPNFETSKSLVTMLAPPGTGDNRLGTACNEMGFYCSAGLYSPEMEDGWSTPQTIQLSHFPEMAGEHL